MCAEAGAYLLAPLIGGPKGPKTGLVGWNIDFIAFLNRSRSADELGTSTVQKFEQEAEILNTLGVTSKKLLAAETPGAKYIQVAKWIQVASTYRRLQVVLPPGGEAGPGEGVVACQNSDFDPRTDTDDQTSDKNSFS